MKKILLSVFIATLCLACSEKRAVEKEVTITRDETGKTTTTTSESTSGATTSKPAIKTGSVELKIRKTHLFSNQTRPDNFELNLTGKTLLTSTIRFTITSAEGQEIYREELTAADLEASLVYEMTTPTATEKQREAFIRKRLNAFFDEKNFNTPAIAPNDTYDPSFGNETAWNAIKKAPKSISFSYLVGKENGRRIAYSEQTGKAMVVSYFGG